MTDNLEKSEERSESVSNTNSVLALELKPLSLAFLEAVLFKIQVTHCMLSGKQCCLISLFLLQSHTEKLILNSVHMMSRIQTPLNIFPLAVLLVTHLYYSHFLVESWP